MKTPPVHELISKVPDQYLIEKIEFFEKKTSEKKFPQHTKKNSCIIA